MRTLRLGQRWAAATMRALGRVEVTVDAARWGLRRRYGKLGPLLLANYGGHGTGTQLTLRGRVLEAGEFPPWLPHDRGWANFRHMWRRFNSRELPGAEVSAHYGDARVSGTTDEEGYFELSLVLPDLPTPHSDWLEVDVEVVAAPLRGFSPVRGLFQVRVPNVAAEFGIVSDIDDTVLQSSVTRKLRLLRLTLFGSPFTRKPFEGTTELFTALTRGSGTGTAANPVFYVSKSPWNLHDFLQAFLDRQGLPRGPLFLRDLGLHEKAPIDFKTQCIEQLLTTYARLPFVLIGDSGEHDAAIYSSVAARWPGRIRAIYIRDLDTTDATRTEAREAARKMGVPLVFARHAGEALEHAQRIGLAARGTVTERHS